MLVKGAIGSGKIFEEDLTQEIESEVGKKNGIEEVFGNDGTCAALEVKEEFESNLRE